MTLSTACLRAYKRHVAEAAGIRFQHYSCDTPMQYIQESLGSGLGWIDYNNDGWPDLLVLQAGPVRPRETQEKSDPLRTNKLHRNNGDGTFTDVTEEVGLIRSGAFCSPVVDVWCMFYPSRQRLAA